MKPTNQYNADGTSPSSIPDKPEREQTFRPDNAPYPGLAEAVIRQTPIGVLVIDSHGRIAMLNPSALEVFDLDRDKIHETSREGQATVFLETLAEDIRDRWQAMINLALGTQQQVTESRFYHHSRYLEKVLSLKIIPLTVPSDEADAVLIVAEDITEEVTTEQFVILSEKLVARKEMAVSMAHKLNNHLTLIANNAELMALNMDREKFDKARFNSRSIIDSVFKVKRFIENMVGSFRPEPDYISYDIRRLIDDLLFSLRIQPCFKAVHFTIDLPEQIPNIEMGVGLIQQVLQNILTNASDAIEEKAARQGGTDDFVRRIGIKASHDKTNETVSVEISDNGCGMSEKTLGKIFTLHFTTKKGGHGLGLYNCRAIAEAHGGSLAARSIDGKGSIFTLTLPRFRKKPKRNNR